MLLLETQKEPKKSPLLPIAREARLKSAWFVLTHERFAKRALKNLRNVGLAAARRRFLYNGTRPHQSFLAPLEGSHSPYFIEEFRSRRGQYGEERKSVKKNAALLHFLAFLLLDHIFGVLRGE